ncbi:MAG: response regulator, partial [Prolixibacteraceae bacterium]|nr:response regulator [Prolixibacteraceae bacterium]
KKITENFKELAKGNLNTSIPIRTKNEIGELSIASQKIQNEMKRIVSYSKKVSNGDFSSELTPLSKDDEISAALNEMARNLREVNHRLENEKWIQNGINKLENLMRGNFSVRELSTRIITYLSQFLEFPLGAVYVYDEVLKHYEFTGSIGLNPEQVQKFIKPGEGLIGKTADTKSIQILNTFNKYHKIFSATGEINPEKLYLIPLAHNDQIQAVIEIAAPEEFNELKMQFIKEAGESISINLNAAVARFRHKELLDKTLEQAGELQKREEELGLNLEENKAMQVKLRRQKALLDAMLGTLPDYIYFKDENSKFLRISESMVSLFSAKSSDEIIGKDDFDFHPEKDAQRYFNEEKEIMATGKGFIDEIRQGVNEKGEELWTSVSKLPMYDETGKCIGTFGISKDITSIKKLEVEVKEQNDNLLDNKKQLEETISEIKQIQDQLLQEKALVDSLLENIPDAIYFKDNESKFLKVSRSMREIFKSSGNIDLIGLSDFDIQDQEHAQKAFDDEQEIMKTGKPKVGYVEKETMNDGSVRYVLSTKMPYFDGKGNVIGTFGISRDITQLKQLELEIQEQNEELKTQQEKLSQANKELTAQEEELRTSNEELKSQEEELRVANEELAEQTKILTESEKNLQIQQEELRVANEELEHKTTELEEQKKEITKKNNSLLKIQDELKQKAKELEMASQYKSEFLANMSHELRTPLNSMLILSKLLAGNKKQNLTEEQIKSVNIIHKSGKDLLELINEILDLSKIEAGKMTYEFLDIASEDIRSEISFGFKTVIEDKGLSLNIEKSENFPAKIFSDRQRLMQIIKNLLSNAIKFTSSGGIKVKMGIPDDQTNFRSQHLNSRNTFFIEVEDTGVGIPQNKVEDIFEAFQQADGSISRKFGGTGLGLSISKQLVNVLGGEIHVKSKEGVGSSFIIFLPTERNLVGSILETENDKAVKPASKNEKRLDNQIVEIKEEKETKELIPEIPFFIEDDRGKYTGDIKILIIHPDKAKAQKLLELCHRKKFNVLASSNIADGIILAKKYQPKAVILAAALNEPKDLEKLKNNTFTSRLPIHLVTKIEDNTLSDLDELKTPESEDFSNYSQNLESKINKEFNQVLVVEDDPATLEAIHLLFEEKDIIIHDAKNGQQAFDLISAKTFDCIILDLGLPDFSGQELLKKLSAENIPVPNVIIHTARELTEKELRELHKYSDSIVIKGVKSDERLMDEVSLFLHQVANTLPKSARPVMIDENDEGYKGKKILVVDDDIRNIFAVAQILEEKEIEVLEAENGEVALEVLKENSDIDLVLMDIMMPVMDGYEAMSRIRSMPEFENIPIITLTAKAMKEDYQKAIDHGANDYISKPVDIDKLFSLLKIWLFK